MIRAAESAFWPAERIEEALESAATHAGLVAPTAQARSGALRHGEPIEWVAARLGIEAESVDTTYGELEARLATSAPAIVRMGDAETRLIAVIVGARGGVLLVLAPDLTLRRMNPDRLASRLCAALEEPLLPGIDRMLAEAGIPQSRHASARRATLRQQLRGRRVEGLIRLRPPGGARLARELRRAKLAGRLALFLGAHAAQYVLWLVAWWVVGRAALEGRFDPGWFSGWVLLLATLVPARLIATWTQGEFAVKAGGVLKGRLLDAALRLDPQAVRGQGVGSFVGRVIEAEAVESLALSGGTQALTAGIELAIAGVLLALGAVGPPLTFTLFAWTALAVGCGVCCLRRRSAWTLARLALTHDQVEKMVGHRTRLVQAARKTMHADEDAALERYLAASQRMDAATAWLVAVTPRGWLVVGVLECGITILRGDPSAGELAFALGGVLLAYQALTRLVHGLAELGGAVIAWRQVLPVLRGLAPAEASAVPPASLVATSAEPAAGPEGHGRPAKVLQAQDLAFTHPGRAEPVIQNLSLEVFEGDRILLEGPSGSGKSTLASLLTGLRSPDAGVVLLRGVDQRTLGEDAWRRRIAAAPQFHENHVLTETFAFNVLMGRRWPPRADDVQQAETLCRELGLAELLERMPAGLYEMVGESGWQLSHGERSRLFLARALLQESEIVVLDESFAALDPATLEAALRCAERRAKTLVVIAHP